VVSRLPARHEFRQAHITKICLLRASGNQFAKLIHRDVEQVPLELT